MEGEPTPGNEETVMKINVTPESPLIAQQPPLSKPAAKPKKGISKRNLLTAIILVAAAVAIVFILSGKSYVTPVATTKTTTTIQQVSVSSMTGCEEINKPGSYYLTKNINTTISSGACIKVDADNVKIVCNGEKITGSGPFTDVPPFTYGIEIENRSNVTINGCYVKDFSYGIYLNNSAFIKIANNNVSSNYMSNLYMSKTTSSTLSNNYMSLGAGESSIYIGNGSYNNTIQNNTILFNKRYGIFINSSGNTYLHNYINATPYSFYCYGAEGFSNESHAKGNMCYNNSGCSFLSCKNVNIPVNLSQIYLGKEIRSCGSIVKPGVYEIYEDLPLNRYENVSNPLLLQYGIPCIRIASGNVTLNCNGKVISNSTFAGIYAQNLGNLTLENCKIRHSNFGLMLYNVTKSSVLNTSIYNSTIALTLQNSTLNTVSGFRSSGNAYGIYLDKSNGNLFSSFNVSLNNIGIYLTSSLGNSFNNGVATNNSRMDVFSSQNSANATYNLMQNTKCTYTNAAWATCTNHIAPNLLYTPVIGCMQITKPGNYTLINSIYNAPNYCIRINASNVRLNCGNFSIIAKNGFGTGMLVGNDKNVTIIGCTLANFNKSVAVYNATGIQLLGLKASGGNTGVLLKNVNNSFVAASILGANSTGIRIEGSANNFIEYSTVNNSGVGILLDNSTYNLIENNAGYHNGIGMLLEGNSANNTIQNNTMSSSSMFDYKCIGNGGASAEKGGVNYGMKKYNCLWLAALSQLTPDVSCAGITQPSSIVLQSDGIYPYGYRCFGVNANGTTIDCGGHTIISDSGGTFAAFFNSKGSTIKDCVLKGFTNPLTAYNSSVKIENVTIIGAGSGTGINITYSSNPSIMNSNISDYYIGISISGSKYGQIVNNTVGKGFIAYLLYNSTGFKIYNNIALSSSAVGFKLNDSVFNSFQNNNFASIGGLVCVQKSEGAANNTDLGGNICTASQNCKWATSPGCK